VLYVTGALATGSGASAQAHSPAAAPDRKIGRSRGTLAE
jgi:hypothetical protein